MNSKILTLGSLFDGIGGFPFAASIVGIKPIWAAEIDPACVAVTKNRFPDMEHLGSVTEINGADITPVDIIAFGSPCQGLSCAGKKAGLDDKRSGLFIEAVRIIYEMRTATNGKYPTFIIWENVPGAFSSNKGRDFRTVLSEITKTDIPMPASGKWATAGVVRSAEINVAWRQLDAQYWGVPQRRKRICLVGSFGSNSAEEILFERDSVRGYLTPSKAARERIADDTERSVIVGSECFDARGNGGGIVPTMTGDHNGRVNDYCAVVVQAKGFNEWIIRRLIPLECERLQGYPDGWTELPKIKDMTDDEYSFFLKVFLLDKEIRGKPVKKPPTKASLVKWYNKLDCDGNRYRQLGNSLAIPCALRIVGGIADYIQGAK